MNSANPAMITMARESRGLTKQQLGVKINLDNTFISRMEKGDAPFDEFSLAAIAEGTNYPSSFFSQRGNCMPVHLAWRKRQQVPAKIITPIEAQVNIMRQHVQFITREMNRAVPILPQFNSTPDNTPADIAIALRKKWNLSLPVIDNMVKLLEEQGIIVCSYDFGTARVDSLSILTDDKHPLIVLNRTLSGERQRFSLAYELGQLVMHSQAGIPIGTDIGHEANLFAAEFLMPTEEIRKEFNDGVTLALLGELKRKWKTSMIALLYRADDLGFLTPNQKRYLLQQFNQLKIRRREPLELDVPFEPHPLMQQLLSKYMTEHNITARQMAEKLSIGFNDYRRYYE